ncbi:hypothetical protein FBY35_3996 [Streptomyces sp. SLBN-118]|nr:hypothetical protein FBY35_3996 [Streptomyces sp. SLBN-118]
MAGTRARGLAGAALTMAVVVAATGCSDTDSNPSDTVSKAASVVGSVGSDVTAAASSLASEASGLATMPRQRWRPRLPRRSGSSTRSRAA